MTFKKDYLVHKINSSHVIKPVAWPIIMSCNKRVFMNHTINNYEKWIFSQRRFDASSSGDGL